METPGYFHGVVVNNPPMVSLRSVVELCVIFMKVQSVYSFVNTGGIALADGGLYVAIVDAVGAITSDGPC